MTNREVLRVQAYLRAKFGNDTLSLRRGAQNDIVEVFLDSEFIGTVSRDDEEGEVSYAFSMAVLDVDLPVAV